MPTKRPAVNLSRPSYMRHLPSFEESPRKKNSIFYCRVGYAIKGKEDLMCIVEGKLVTSKSDIYKYKHN